ncbi:MAG: hypothetical protein AB7F89_11735 [Pirellulaceae bacterium]
MLYAYFNQFRKHFPGPYAYFRTTQGVDDAVVIFCEGTEQHIASLFYWDDHLPHELAANVICHALNEQLRSGGGDADEWQPRLSEYELAAFRGMHPGPFAISRFTCPLYGRRWEVRCRTTRRSVIISDTSAPRLERVATATIASVLNALPE